MNLPRVHDPASADARADGTTSRLRLAWTATVPVVALFVASLPTYYERLGEACAGSACISHQLTPEGMRSLRDLGIPADFYAAYSVVLSVLFAGVYLSVAAVILRRAPGEGMALPGAMMLVFFGVVFPETLRAMAEHPFWQWPVSAVAFLGFVSAVLFINLFPGGRFAPRWTILAALVWISAVGQGIFLPGSMEGFRGSLVNSLMFVCAAGASVFALVYRYRREADSIQRQQTKWVVFGIAAALGGIVVMAVFDAVFFSSGPPGLFDTFGFRSAQIVLLLLIPLSIGAAILRYRLWDIDLVINRTLVYGAMSAIVVGLYVLVVGGLGTVLQARGSLLVSILAAGLVAVVFAPLRERLQRLVNRLMYGERDDPYKVLSRLGERLEASLVPDAALSAAVSTVKDALKLPYAAIEAERENSFETVATAGESSTELVKMPLAYGGGTVGRLVLGTRIGEEGFTPADRKLLDGLTRRIGAAVHAARLADEAVRLSSDLQKSRERLVNAREEERRRLRRDLHDGLGPQLASLTMKAEAARDLLSSDPARADALLASLTDQAQSSVEDIRRLVYALRPPALDALGLAGALRTHASGYDGGTPRIAIEAPDELPPLSAAVEVAAYLIAIEATNNAVRHAEASRCVVRISLGEIGENVLRVEITDDGRGFAEECGTGVGLASMRERAEELGGTFGVEETPSGGVRVVATLPVKIGLSAEERVP
ncbi:MAG: sensor histidine kinase [Rubrobacter sp.]|nr:sensor histidine kinase [Rubrobacter sp.]